MEARKGLWVLVVVELLVVRLFLALLSTEDMLPAGQGFPQEGRKVAPGVAWGAGTHCHCAVVCIELYCAHS